ncbi:MAG: hypothetical protein CVU52_10475 [Deltaproteobacteria bacterium HGW-Deltaproteobacteria-10]|nr:MAG: hypothetical protein CVU52_10475 [Deltaproteobacteria bacterium HGW-Deltaproteobacteria-10]
MNLAAILFPRELETDNTAEAIRLALLARTVKIRPESDFVIPRIEMTDPLKVALRQAKFRGHIRCGFEDIAAKLESERIGIANVRQRSAAPYGKRISRLLLFSNDGAGRLYRHIEQIIKSHSPRLLGCLIDMDSNDFGNLITGKDSIVKIVMVEHKAVVCDILRAMIVDLAGPAE